MIAENTGESDFEGKLGMKIAYVDNEKAPVRQWYRILARLRGDQLQIIVLKNAESEEVLQSTQCAFCRKKLLNTFSI